MSKLAIVKSICLFLSICIVVCLFLVILNLQAKKYKISSQKETAQELILAYPSAEIKTFSVQNNKIYLLISSPKEEQLIVVDEQTSSEILKIKLSKGGQ